MEIICDILRVIQEGSARPTQIMHKANLTWPVLMTHFEVLLRHQLLTRETSSSRTTYRLTAKGSAVLNIYLRLRDELDALEGETSRPRHLEEPIESVASSREKNATRSAMRSVLEAANFRVVDEPVPGRSGTKYRFDVVARGLDNSSYGFDVLTHASESEVIRVFVKQLDSDIPVHMIYTKSRSEVAKTLAGSYSMELVHARDFRRLVDLLTFRDALSSHKSALLEVDPSQNYEFVLRELLEDEATRSRISIFTWRGSPVYPLVPRTEKVQVHLMTTQGAKSFPLRPRETVVASHDDAALLESVEGSSARDAKEKGDLVVVDSVSELLVSLGNETTLRFLKRATRSLQGARRRSLFVVKRGYHDERGMSMVRNLFSERLVHDASGLRLDRSA